MKKAPNPLRLLTLMSALAFLALSACPLCANPNKPPQYHVLLCRGTVGGSASGQWAITQASYPNPGAAGIVGYYLNIQEVPGLTTSWTTPGATPIQILEWNPNPKERTMRAAFRYTTPGLYQATLTLTYNCPGGGTASSDVQFQILVIP